MAGWADFFKLWQYAIGTKDPYSARVDPKRLTGAGVSQPDAIPDIRQDGSFWGGGRGLIRLRDSNDFIDLSSVTNRQSRYKEYERLRNVAEIETAMTVFADESCLHGRTIISTLFDGPKSIEWLYNNRDKEDFLVYCWDFEKKDYTLGWAYNPRKVKRAPTIKIRLDDGKEITMTPDHRILLKSGEWVEAGELNFGDELMPFYREQPNRFVNDFKHNQFPRIFTFEDGWKTQRQFIDEWKLGKKEENEELKKTMRLICAGLTTKQVQKEVGREWKTLEAWIHKAGYTFRELRALGSRQEQRRVIGVSPGDDEYVYDLSVREHENFCGESIIFHNCQTNDDAHTLTIEVEDKKVKEELEFLLFHRKMLNVDKRIWNWAKNLFIFGDLFLELIMDMDNPKDGVMKTMLLPPESMFRIETTKGRLIEFQQSKEGPDTDALTKAPVTQATDAELAQSTAIRFHPDQIIHVRIGDDRKTFYPYVVSLIEAARGPAHQLRLMEDAMVVYRLTRAPERRVFYVDVGTLPPFKAESFMERMKDQFRKKKVPTSKGGQTGASQVEERWHPPSQDEDYWIPIRANSNTRVETLPGASNLGEIDDAVYFRNKLFTAMNFPRNYFANEDPNATRITLSAQDVKFARLVERLQSSLEDGFWEICDRHLKLRGFPEELYEDLVIKMTPPSDWRELSRAEVVTNRINNANNLKGSQLFSDFDIMVDWLKLPPEEAKEKISRLKIQKLEDLKIQILAQNPALLGVGIPGQGEQEIGAQAGGPAPMLGGPEAGGMGMPPPPGPEMAMSGEGPPPAPGAEGGMEQGPMGQMPQGQPGAAAAALPDPSDDEIKKYDLGIQNYSKEKDLEDIDYSEI
jgi:hypothetical protein